LPRNLSAEDIVLFRDRLCDAAERLFAESGPDAVTIRQLAADVGVSPMTPYRYFKDKDAILAAVRARAFDRHAETLERAYDEAEANPLSRANAIGEAYVAFAFEHPAAYRVMFDVNQPSANDYPDLVRSGDRSRATMTRHLYDLKAAGLLRGDPNLIGHMYWAALHGAIMLQLSGMLVGPLGARALIDALMVTLSRSTFGPKDPA
jgi:AcrR family transcriptional regulator